MDNKDLSVIAFVIGVCVTLIFLSIGSIANNDNTLEDCKITGYAKIGKTYINCSIKDDQ